VNIFGIHTSEQREDQKSIMCTRTFHPFSKEPSQVFSYLSKNIEEACARMRKLGLSSKNFSIFIKTKDFRYIGGEVKLVRETSYPEEILNEARKVFDRIFDATLVYRTTGVRLGSLKPIAMQTESLFEENKNIGKGRMYDVVDDIAADGKVFSVSVFQDRLAALINDNVADIILTRNVIQLIQNFWLFDRLFLANFCAAWFVSEQSVWADHNEGDDESDAGRNHYDPPVDFFPHFVRDAECVRWVHGGCWAVGLHKNKITSRAGVKL
jgi:hypothetical protein